MIAKKPQTSGEIRSKRLECRAVRPDTMASDLACIGGAAGLQHRSAGSLLQLWLVLGLGNVGQHRKRCRGDESKQDKAAEEPQIMRALYRKAVLRRNGEINDGDHADEGGGEAASRAEQELRPNTIGSRNR